MNDKSMWISVDDRLPDDHGIFLAATPSGFVGTMTFNLDQGWRSLKGKDPIYWNNTITHWMPLPDPPKADQ